MPDLISDLTGLIVRHLEEAQALDQLGPLADMLRLEADHRSRPTRVISAEPLSPEQQATISDSIEHSGIEFLVDPHLVGGIILEHEGKRTDLSWRKRLEEKL